MGAIAAAPATQLLAAGSNSAGTVKGRVTAAGKGISGVVMSDGYTVTTTAKNGDYEITLHSDAQFVFMSIPAGYHIPHEKGIARFYQPVTRNQSAQTANFQLQKNEQDDTRHALIVWADTQMVKDEDALTLVNVSAPDTAAEIRSRAISRYMALQWVTWCMTGFDLFDDYARAVEITGIPFFQVIGNHDMTYAARTDEGSQQQFRQLFGPGYFSFNRVRCII